ncbi:2',3'-cyclic-nucleotide 2'-phosphodiesterase / 3'-nucleotidase / 5'-nucleotidase [Evansella caseinilytica]|uniref:2',3'-cyclic-nucleotide 2'-phosphodiesterase / 3'-nucleotidase / 5'-nucleotidase n=1 Tax=Evansella caseinilytica TaxID=1503961 RepID=A0A1H3TY03_9BACI|nr:5'-nucleotidase C-terminal domain-containing protein [Evansella caseinilytica]SDZ54641.1 2',3'-cyclic-nucleotide 2'-phosphodiesterase / 3'-nucleotidase / 5'-nucleotidase [Evansella caseinilytica]
MYFTRKKWARAISLLLILSFVFSTLTPLTATASASGDEEVMTVAEAVASNDGIGTVEGYVVGHTVNANQYNFAAPFANDFNLLLADSPEERDSDKLLHVQITSGFRSEFGLQTNPEMIGEKIRVTGSLESYYTKAGLKAPASMTFVHPQDPGTPDEQEAAPIADVRTLGSGAEVTVRGIVTTVPGSWGGNGFYLQDDTAGVHVFGSSDVKQGDEVILTGETGEYNGEFQISNLSSVTVIGEGALPDPIIVSPSQIHQQTQGQLVTIENAKIQNLTSVNSYGTFEFSAASGGENVLVRVDNRTGLIFDDFSFQNGDVVHITGIASVYNGTYQLKPRGVDDILPGEAGVPDPDEPPLDDDMLELTILHTNDIHSRIDGLGKSAAYINKERQAAANALYLDAGDIFSGSPVNDINLGVPIVQILNEMELDAMAIGNHEFDYGQGVFAERVTDSSFPWLSANMLVDPDIAIEQPDPYTIFSFDDFDVAVFSLTQNPPATAPGGIVGIEFLDYVDTALQYKEELEAQADIIIALTHIGYGDDRSLAQAVDYFDVIIGGHSHTVLNTPAVVNGTPIVQAGSYGSHVGKLQISIDPDSKEVATVSGELQRIDALTETDPDVQEIIDYWNGQMEDILNIVIGESDTGLSRDGRFDGDAPLGNFWTDAMRYIADADIAFTNNGGIRDSIAPGEITVGDIYRIEPFDNQIMLIEMTGRAIKDVLAFSYSREGRNQIDLQTSGLHYTVLTNASGQYSDVIMTIGGQPLDLNETYRVAVADYIGTGGSGYTFDGDVIYGAVAPMTTAMIDFAEYLSSQGQKLNYSSEGRITVEVDPEAEEPTGEVIGSTISGLYSANKIYMDAGLGNLYADAVRAAGNTDIGLLNGSSVTGNIPPGNIAAEQIQALDVYQNKIVVVEASGATIKEMILSQSNYYRTVDLQASGLIYTLVKDTGSQTFNDIRIFLEDGTPLMDEEAYTVAYNDYMHGGYYNLGSNVIADELGLVWEAVAEFIRTSASPIDYTEGERISVEIIAQPVLENNKVILPNTDIARTMKGSTLVIDVSSAVFANTTEIFFTAEQIATLRENNVTLRIIVGEALLTIPASIFGEGEVTFTFVKVPDEELDEQAVEKLGKLVSSIYDFTITQAGEMISDFGQEFIELSFAVNTALVEKTEHLSFRYFDESDGQWQEIPGMYQDGWMHGFTSYFSMFAVFEVAESDETVDPELPGDEEENPKQPSDGDNDPEQPANNNDDNRDDNDDNGGNRGSDSGSAGGNNETESKLPVTATSMFQLFLIGTLVLFGGAVMLAAHYRKKRFV